MGVLVRFLAGERLQDAAALAAAHSQIFDIAQIAPVLGRDLAGLRPGDERLPGLFLGGLGRAYGLDVRYLFGGAGHNPLRCPAKVECFVDQLPGRPCRARRERAVGQLGQLRQGGVAAGQDLPGGLHIAGGRPQLGEAFQRPRVEWGDILGAHFGALAALQFQAELFIGAQDARGTGAVEDEAVFTNRGFRHAAFPSVA